MHYSLMGKIRLPFIDSDLLYRGTLKGRFDCPIKTSNQYLLFSLLFFESVDSSLYLFHNNFQLLNNYNVLKYNNTINCIWLKT
jgi:hypothetical protein